MPPKRKAERKLTGSSSNKSRTTSASSGSTKAGNDLPASAGYLISCDVPTKQYIQHLNDEKTQDKKFILEDLDAEHLLIKTKARAEIDAKVERWMDAVSVCAAESFALHLYITSVWPRRTTFHQILILSSFLFVRMFSLLLNVLEKILICRETSSGSIASFFDFMLLWSVK